MKTIKIDPNNPNPKAIDEAVEILKNGGVVAYPTDTCYGLGVDMANPFALERLYKIKGRDYNKPIAAIFKNISEIKKTALVEEKQQEFLKKYLPGKLTIILLNTDFSTYKNISIGIRIPRYKLTQILAEKFDRPYSTTSANVSGQPACYSAAEIVYQFKKQKYQPDLILDAGRLAKTPPSTVVDLIKWPPRILRQGSVKINV